MRSSQHDWEHNCDNNQGATDNAAANATELVIVEQQEGFLSFTIGGVDHASAAATLEFVRQI